MKHLDRITMNPERMGGKPCIRGTRVTVGTIVNLIADNHSPDDILEAYPYLERPDIQAALRYAAWRSEESEVALEEE
jgi:uncharacterized protein (DUF433 family)